MYPCLCVLHTHTCMNHVASEISFTDFIFISDVISQECTVIIVGLGLSNHLYQRIAFCFRL